MHGVNANGLGHGQQHRREDQNQRRHVHQSAQHQQHDVDHGQDHVTVIAQRGQQRSDFQRNLHQRHDVAEAGCKTNQDHDNRHRFDRAVHQLGQVAPAVVTVNEHGHKEGPNHRNRGRLGGGKNTAHDAAQNDDHGHQAPHGVQANFQRLRHRDHATLGVVAFTRHIQTINRQTQTQQQARKNTGHEQRSHRHRAAGRHGINHSVVAGWNQDGLNRTTDSDRRGEWTRVTVFFHFRNQHRPDRRRIGHRRAGNRAEKGGGQNIDQRQTTAHKADQHAGKSNQSARHAAFCHDGAGQHKTGDGQQ